MLQKKYPLVTAILFWSGLPIMSNLYASINKALSIGSFYAVSFAFGCLIFGPLSEKYGRKNVIILGHGINISLIIIYWTITKLRSCGLIFVQKIAKTQGFGSISIALHPMICIYKPTTVETYILI